MVSSSTADRRAAAQTSRTNARARASSFRSLEISISARISGSRRSSIRTATHVRSSPNRSELENATASRRICSMSSSGSRWPCRWTHSASRSMPNSSPCGVTGFRQPVRIEQQDVARLHRDRQLLEDLALADAERQVLPLQQPAGPGARLEVNGRRVPAIDEVEPPLHEIQPGVAQGDEALELDQLPRDLRMRERDDVLRLGQRPGRGE